MSAKKKAIVDRNKPVNLKVAAVGMDVPYTRILKWKNEPGFPLADGLTTVEAVDQWFKRKMSSVLVPQPS